MSAELLVLARDYNSLVDRVSESLLSLKKELTIMRKQDIKLLKQLTHISDVIQTFCQHIKEDKPNEIVSPDSAIETSPTSHDVTFDGKSRMPLLRQQSVPYYCGILRSLDSFSVGSSFEDIMEYPSDSESLYFPEDSECLFALDTKRTFPDHGDDKIYMGRIRSFSMESPVRVSEIPDDDYYDEILRKNIQMWKLSKVSKVSTSCQDYDEV